MSSRVVCGNIGIGGAVILAVQPGPCLPVLISVRLFFYRSLYFNHRKVTDGLHLFNK